MGAIPAAAIDGKSAADLPKDDKEFWYVGRVQWDGFNPPDTHTGTGSYFAGGLAYTDPTTTRPRGAVLTVAHAINQKKATKPGELDKFVQRFERFQLVDKGPQLPALGVQHPKYRIIPGLSVNDIGLLLVLNGPARAADQTFPTLARPRGGGAGPDVLAAGAKVEVIGFTKPGGGSTKRRGMLEIPNPAGDNITNELYGFPKDPSPDFVEPGDSGGPNLAQVGGAKRIVGVTRSASKPPGTLSEAVRVDNHNAFLAGDGAENKRVIVRWKDGANTDWSNDNRWERSSQLKPSKPELCDVVVLDPTTGPDKTKQVTVDEKSAFLDGLLNDVTLTVKTQELRVFGNIGDTPSSGVLNGGVINIGDGAVGTRGLLTIGAGLENAKGGTINVMTRGELSFGLSTTGGGAELSLLNDVGATINAPGGKVSGKDFANHGTIEILSNGEFFGALGFNSGLARAQNGGRIIVDKLANAGNIVAGRTAANETAGRISVLDEVANLPPGVISAEAGDLSFGSLKNEGKVNVKPKGSLFARISITNTATGTIDVRGRAKKPDDPNDKDEKAYLSAPKLTNDGTVKVGPHGTMNVVEKLGKNAWQSDPAVSIIHQKLTLTPTGYYQGIGPDNEVYVGGHYRNFSQQNTLFDHTTSTLTFVDPEALNDISNIVDPEVDPLFLDLSPSEYSERTFSRMFWPSRDLTSPNPGEPPRVLLPGAATLYVETLSLTAGPEDDPADLTIMNAGGRPIPAQHVTTLDLRGGGVIYLANPLDPNNPLPENTRIWDSLNPTRPLLGPAILNPLIRPLSLGLFPADNFNIGTLSLDGADYVIARGVPEPAPLALFVIGLYALLPRDRRRAARRCGD
jgi:hypothetical protein